MADFSFKVADNYIPQVLEECEEKVRTALQAAGVKAASNAREYVKQVGAIDTGLLRNSITYALDGESPRIKTYSGKDNSKTGSKGKSGSYSGSAPSSGKNNHTVYIGTNVEYAPYVELGTKKMNARPFLKPAMENHMDDYRTIIKSVLSK